jgi:hypothetical protein
MIAILFGAPTRRTTRPGLTPGPMLNLELAERIDG